MSIVPRILLIEDNPGDALLVQEGMKALEGRWPDVKHVICLEDGLSALEQDSFHLVLLDLSLPDSQGLEGMEQIKSRFPEVPVVVLTGADDPAMRTEVLAAGARKYLTKGHVLTEAFRYAEMWHEVLENVEEEDEWSAMRSFFYEGKSGPTPATVAEDEWQSEVIVVLKAVLEGKQSVEGQAGAPPSPRMAARILAKNRAAGEQAVQCVRMALDGSAEVGGAQRPARSLSRKLMVELLIELSNAYRDETSG